MVRDTKKQALRQQLSRGGYVVDPRAVAEAMLRLAGHRTSSMFVAFESGEPSASRAAHKQSGS
jgi:Anti-sigma-28 factor, FlgM